jgi:hypothetical protein
VGAGPTRSRTPVSTRTILVGGPATGVAGGAPSRHGVPNTEANPVLWPFWWRQVPATDAEIHGLVGELYGLTQEETAIE